VRAILNKNLDRGERWGSERSVKAIRPWHEAPHSVRWIRPTCEREKKLSQLSCRLL